MSPPPTGDLTNDGAHSYQYDAEGRLVSVDNGTTASYVYNALGERVEEDAGGTYSEYVFDKDGNPRGVNNRSTWVDTWVDFAGSTLCITKTARRILCIRGDWERRAL